MKFYINATQWGNKILYRGYEGSRSVTLKDDFQPTLFVNSKTKSEWSSLDGNPVEEIKFSDINDAKDFAKRYKDVEGFDVHGDIGFNYQYLNKHFPSEIEYDTNLMKIWPIDIETASEDGFPDIQTANEEILLITVQDRTTRKSITFGSRPYTGTKTGFEYKGFKNEVTMLKEFIMYWQQNYPDIVTGWNTDQFDFPYIVNRIVRVLGEDWAKKLSPFNIIKEKLVEIRGKEIQTYELVGIVQLDYLDLYKKFTYNQLESYSLQFVVQHELSESKLENPTDNFKDFYTHHWNMFVEYNVHDAVLVNKLDDKMKLIDLVISIAYLVKCNIRDVFGPVKTWDVFIYNYLSQKKIAIPPHKNKHGGDFEGAWVKDVKPGMYSWGMSFDFASLYPTIIRQWNLSPETLVRDYQEPIKVDDVVNCEEGLSSYAFERNYSVAANGSLYRKDKKGILPELMEYLMVGRKVSKKEMLKLEQEYQMIASELKERGENL